MEESQQVASAMLSTTQQILQAIYQSIKEKGGVKEEQEKLMQKFLHGTGAVVGSVCQPYHLSEVKKELINNHIPFMEFAGQQDGTMILVRKEHEQQLLDIENGVSMKDTSLAKELSFDNGIKAFETLNIRKVITLSFKDEDMAEIAKQKLFQTGQTFISTQKENGDIKLAVFPSSTYQSNGKDLEYFKLTYALTQAKGDIKFASEKEKENGDLSNETELIRLRKLQAKYDRQIVEDFIRKAKTGKHVVLGNTKGNGRVYIEAVNGTITVIDRSLKTETPITYDKTDSINVMSATLSRYTDDIYNMGVFDGDYYEARVKNTPIKRSDLPSEITNNPRPDILDFGANGQPLYEKDTVLLYRFFTNAAESLVNEINREATKRVNESAKAALLSPEKKSAMKHKEIIELLNDETYQPVKDFLETEAYDVPREIREEILKSLTENYTNEQQATRYSVDIQEEDVRDLEQTNIQEQKTEKQQEFTIERES